MKKEEGKRGSYYCLFEADGSKGDGPGIRLLNGKERKHRVAEGQNRTVSPIERMVISVFYFFHF